MIVDFDIDLESGLPNWDFCVLHQGVKYPVKFPSGLQLSRLFDLKDKTREEACAGHIQLLVELTGLDRNSAAGFDSERICAFFAALGDLIQKRLEYRSAMRKKLPAAFSTAMPGAADRPN